MTDGILPMTDADLDEVAALEARCHAYPWSRGNFADALVAGYGAWLFREDGRLASYSAMMRGVEEAHLLNITVTPELQGRGRGTAFLGFLLAQAREWSARRVLLEVRPGNMAALAMYRRNGFSEIGRRRGYYHGPAGSEDAIVMERVL